MRLTAVTLTISVFAAGCAHQALPRTAPIPVDAALSMQLEPASRVLDSAIAAGAAPGAVLAVSLRGRHFEHAIGQLAVDDPRPPDGRTLYDMASLTKVVAHDDAHDDGGGGTPPRTRHTGRALPPGVRARQAATSRACSCATCCCTTADCRPIRSRRSGSIRGAAHAPSKALARRSRHGTRRAHGLLRSRAPSRSRRSSRNTITSDLTSCSPPRDARPLGLARMRFIPPREWRDEIAPTEMEALPGRRRRRASRRSCTTRTRGDSAASPDTRDCSAMPTTCCASVSGRWQVRWDTGSAVGSSRHRNS